MPLETHETWPCPVCGRSVEIVAPPHAMKQRGYWLPPSAHELVVVCSRIHRNHARHGGPLPVPEPVDPEVRWVPVERGVDRAGRTVLVVLVEPAVVLVEREGSWDVLVLRDLVPSLLVGSFARLVAAGEPAGRVPAAQVVLHPSGEPLLDWDELAAGQWSVRWRSATSATTSSAQAW